MKDYKKTLLYKKIIDLTDMTELSLDKLFNTITIKQIKRHENILNQGIICRNIFFVENGYLRIYTNKDGKEINTDFIFENSFTTNLKSLRLAIPSDTTFQAGELSTIYEFDKDILLALYKESPEIESFGRKLLEQLLIAQEEHANLFKIFKPEERYKYLQTNKPELLQRVSLSQISSYIGVARETLSRIRKK